MSTSNTRLSLGQRLSYGLPNLGIAMIAIPVLLYLPRFYTDVVGVPVFWIGLVFVAGRVIDAVSDPLVGFVSDRTRTRLGRRRPWLLWGALPLALLTLALYIPPTLSQNGVTAWVTGSVLLWFLALTAVNVPYRALGPELTDDYDERTGLFSIREGLLVVGTVLAAAGPGAIGAALGLVEGQDDRLRFGIYAGIAASVLVVTALVCGLGVKERFDAPSKTMASPSPSAFIKAAREALSNRPFAILLAAFVIIALGSSLPAVLINYFVTYVLQSDKLPLFLMIYFGVGMVCLPGWVALSKRKSKKFAWLAALTINFGVFACVGFVGPGQELLYGILVAGSGIGGVAVIALPYAMQADVIDLDEHASGERREGIYSGLWSIAEKAAAALGVGLSMFALDAVGYKPNEVQSDDVLIVLRLLYIGVPCVCTLGGLLVALRYPVDREAHAAALVEIARERKANAKQ